MIFELKLGRFESFTDFVEGVVCCIILAGKVMPNTPSQKLLYYIIQAAYLPQVHILLLF